MSWHSTVSNYESAVKKFKDVLNIEPKYFRDEDFAFPNLMGAQFFLGGVALNVIGSKTDDTSIAQFVKKQGEGLFLVSLLVDDIERDVKESRFIKKTANSIHPFYDHGHRTPQFVIELLLTHKILLHILPL
jgi:hypothetical protein